MNKLIKTLETIGQTDSIHQNIHVQNKLTEMQLLELSKYSEELTCSHFPGDDDDDQD